MGRQLGIVALVTLVLAATACSRTVGDRRLVDEWAAMPEAKLVLPVAGECSRAGGVYSYEVVPAAPQKVASCAELHTLELIHLGVFTGADADRPTPPPKGSDAHRRAHAECVKAAVEFLGDDWKTGWLDLVYLPASDLHWTGGARYFRCDLVEVTGEQGVMLPRVGTARDGLRGDKPLAVRCVDAVNVQGELIAEVGRADCTQPHDYELAGVVRLPEGPYPDERTLERVYNAACVATIGSFLGIRPDAPVAFGYLQWEPSKDEWEVGDRGGTCYVGAYGSKKLKQSVRGWGNRPLPT
jgi:hypothetical protein